MSILFTDANKFRFSVDNPRRNYAARAWVDTTGAMQLIIACQSHPITQWRECGQEIICNSEYGTEFPVKSRDILGLVFGDDKVAQLARIEDYLADVKKNNHALLEGIAELQAQLTAVLTFVETVLAPTQKAVLEKIEKAKHKAGTNGKKAVPKAKAKA